MHFIWIDFIGSGMFCTSAIASIIAPWRICLAMAFVNWPLWRVPKFILKYPLSHDKIVL